MSAEATEVERYVARAIRTPRAAALAGIAFSLLFTAALVLVRLAVPADSAEAGEWLTDGSRRDAVLVALGLVPFAGIAFLWFVGVLRDRVGESEDRFFATVFLGSALLFVALLFVASALAAGLVMTAGEHGDSFISSDTWEAGSRTTNELMDAYGMRMAAVFTLVACTILSRAGRAPRWLTAGGLATGILLLLAAGLVPWIELLFPAWVLLLSAYVLVASLRTGRPPSRGRPGS